MHHSIISLRLIILTAAMGWLMAVGAPLGAETPVVENGAQPSGTVARLVFEEDLRIGPDSGEGDHLLWSGASVTVDANQKGDIFVTDVGGNRVLQFDAKGKFLKQIGGKGEGPGEFQILSSFKILDDQSAIAFDNRQVSVTFSRFDREMTYVDRETRSSFGKIMQSAIFAGNGNLLGSFYMIPNKDNTTINGFTAILSKDFEPREQLGQVTLDRFNRNEIEKPSWWTGYLAKWFEVVTKGVGLFAFGSENRIYTAVSNQYEITVWDGNLQKIRTVRREFKPIIMTEREKDALATPIRDEILSVLPAAFADYMTDRVVRRALEEAELAPRKPPIFSIIPLERDGFLVVHDYDHETGRAMADIFNGKGEFTGHGELPKIRINFFGDLFGNNAKMIFKNGFAYVIEDLDDEATMIRYRYTLKR